MKNNILGYLKKTYNYLLQNNVFLYLLFISLIVLINYIYCIFFIKKFPEMVGINGDYLIDKVGFNFSEIISPLLDGKPPVAKYYGIDWYVSRMPLFPYFLYYMYSFISKKFIIIHLLKNVFFSTIIFLLIKNLSKKFNNYYIVFSLFLLFYVPHNLWVTISTNFEEGILNYLIIILFLLLLSELKFKSIFIAFCLSVIYFLKASMFYLCLCVSIIYIFREKKFRYIPIILFFFSNLIWGIYSYSKTNYFAFGIKSTSFNSITMASAYNKEFNLIYPRISPDRIFEKFEDEIIKQGFKNEWQVDEFMMRKNINFFFENPKEVFVGILKKINVILFYPFKDSQHINPDGTVSNNLRFSNFINKPVFIISLFIVFIRLKENFFRIEKLDNLNFYYPFIVVSYFFPYLVAFIYSRHCTSIYMISHLYLYYNILNFKNLKKLFINSK